MTHSGCEKFLPGSRTDLLCCWILTKNVRIKNCKSKSNEVLVNDRFMCHIYLFNHWQCYQQAAQFIINTLLVYF